MCLIIPAGDRWGKDLVVLRQVPFPSSPVVGRRGEEEGPSIPAADCWGIRLGYIALAVVPMEGWGDALSLGGVWPMRWEKSTPEGP